MPIPDPKAHDPVTLLGQLDLLLGELLVLRSRLQVQTGLPAARRPGWPIRRAAQPAAPESASIWSRQISML